MDLEKEIKEMDMMFEDAVINTDAPGTDAIATDAPSTESISTESPSTESPSTESPSTEAPVTEVPDRLSELEAENQKIREKLAELEAKEKSPKTEAPTTEAPIDEIDFLGDIDPEDAIRDPDEFNKILNSVFKKGVEAGRNSQEKVLRSIPDIVSHNLEIVTKLKEVSDKFYSDNEDLKPFKKVVATVFEEKMAENPEKSYEEIMKDVGPETRKRLELHQKATKKETKPPALQKKKGQVRQPNPPKPDALTAELDAMDKALDY